MAKVPASPVTSGMHIEADTEHFSHRDGTLLVGANFDKNQLGKHDIEKIDTHTLDHLKTTADGRTILIPQPTDDPLQSLNWSWRKKHIVLFVLTYCTLMTDMSSAWSIPLVITQAEYWGISSSNAGRNLSGNIFVRWQTLSYSDTQLIINPLDAWSGWNCSSSSHSMAGPTSCPVLVHDHCIFYVYICCCGPRLDIVHCGPLLAGFFRHCSPGRGLEHAP
jgi:hypothetical protein